MGAGMPPPGAGAPNGPPQDQMLKGLLQMGMELDRGLLALTQSAPEGAKEFGMAKQLIQAGIAKVVAAKSPGSPATSPTEAGSQFTGGSFQGPGGF